MYEALVLMGGATPSVPRLRISSVARKAVVLEVIKSCIGIIKNPIGPALDWQSHNRQPARPPEFCPRLAEFAGG